MPADLPRQRPDCAPAPPPHPSLGLTRFLPPHPPARSCLLLISSTLSGSGPCPLRLSFRSFSLPPPPPLHSFLPSSRLLDCPWLLLAILHPGPWHAFTTLPLCPPACSCLLVFSTVHAFTTLPLCPPACSCLLVFSTVLGLHPGLWPFRKSFLFWRALALYIVVELLKVFEGISHFALRQSYLISD